jgi:NADH dehydrogenase
MPERPRVVIVGAGFAGLSAARALRHADVDLIVIDRKNHHTFQPLLYQVASAGLSPADIAAPIRRILRAQPNCRVVLGEVRAIDTGQRSVATADATFSYDFLIVATGATHSYFGNDHWARFAPGLKTIEDALDIRRRVLRAFEHAENATGEDERRAAMTFAIVGAGPTGVEMAGALAEIALKVIRADYRNIDTAGARIVLIEAADRVLPAMDAECSRRALTQLQSLGVSCWLGRKVTGVDEQGVTLGEGGGAERLACRTIIWAAGVRGSRLGAMLAPAGPRGRVPVGTDLALEGHPEVFVTGDLARAHNPDGSEVPGVAPAAMQTGRHAGETIARLVARAPDPRRPFVYRDKGLLATIGRHRATGQIFGRHVHGFVAWVLWAWVHLFFLIGFRNRLVVMLEWTWNYLTFQRGARLITDPIAPAEPAPGGGA